MAAVAFGFEHLGLDEIVAFTVPANLRSQAVMRRLGMATRPEDDFDHPGVAEGHRRRRYVLYRLGAAEWDADRLHRVDRPTGSGSGAGHPVIDLPG
jgi:RimJ/RimL family protein N-acetyltransferase